MLSNLKVGQEVTSFKVGTLVYCGFGIYDIFYGHTELYMSRHDGPIYVWDIVNSILPNFLVIATVKTSFLLTMMLEILQPPSSLTDLNPIDRQGWLSNYQLRPNTLPEHRAIFLPTWVKIPQEELNV